MPTAAEASRVAKAGGPKVSAPLKKAEVGAAKSRAETPSAANPGVLEVGTAKCGPAATEAGGTEVDTDVPRSDPLYLFYLYDSCLARNSKLDDDPPSDPTLLFSLIWAHQAKAIHHLSSRLIHAIRTGPAEALRAIQNTFAQTLLSEIQALTATATSEAAAGTAAQATGTETSSNGGTSKETSAPEGTLSKKRKKKAGLSIIESETVQTASALPATVNVRGSLEDQLIAVVGAAKLTELEPQIGSSALHILAQTDLSREELSRALARLSVRALNVKTHWTEVMKGDGKAMNDEFSNWIGGLPLTHIGLVIAALIKESQSVPTKCAPLWLFTVGEELGKRRVPGWPQRTQESTAWRMTILELFIQYFGGVEMDQAREWISEAFDYAVMGPATPSVKGSGADSESSAIASPKTPSRKRQRSRQDGVKSPSKKLSRTDLETKHKELSKQYEVLKRCLKISMETNFDLVPKIVDSLMDLCFVPGASYGMLQESGPNWNWFFDHLLTVLKWRDRLRDLPAFVSFLSTQVGRLRGLSAIKSCRVFDRIIALPFFDQAQSVVVNCRLNELIGCADRFADLCHTIGGLDYEYGILGLRVALCFLPKVFIHKMPRFLEPFLVLCRGYVENISSISPEPMESWSAFQKHILPRVLTISCLCAQGDLTCVTIRGIDQGEHSFDRPESAKLLPLQTLRLIAAHIDFPPSEGTLACTTICGLQAYGEWAYSEDTQLKCHLDASLRKLSREHWSNVDLLKSSSSILREFALYHPVDFHSALFRALLLSASKPEEDALMSLIYKVMDVGRIGGIPNFLGNWSKTTASKGLGVLKVLVYDARESGVPNMASEECKPATNDSLSRPLTGSPLFKSAYPALILVLSVTNAAAKAGACELRTLLEVWLTGIDLLASKVEMSEFLFAGERLRRVLGALICTTSHVEEVYAASGKELPSKEFVGALKEPRDLFRALCSNVLISLPVTEVEIVSPLLAGLYKAGRSLWLAKESDPTTTEVGIFESLCEDADSHLFVAASLSSQWADTRVDAISKALIVIMEESQLPTDILDHLRVRLGLGSKAESLTAKQEIGTALEKVSIQGMKSLIEQNAIDHQRLAINAVESHTMFEDAVKELPTLLLNLNFTCLAFKKFRTLLNGLGEKASSRKKTSKYFDALVHPLASLARSSDACVQALIRLVPGLIAAKLFVPVAEIAEVLLQLVHLMLAPLSRCEDHKARHFFVRFGYEMSAMHNRIYSVVCELFKDDRIPLKHRLTILHRICGALTSLRSASREDKAFRLLPFRPGLEASSRHLTELEGKRNDPGLLDENNDLNQRLAQTRKKCIDILERLVRKI